MAPVQNALQRDAVYNDIFGTSREPVKRQESYNASSFDAYRPDEQIPTEPRSFYDGSTHHPSGPQLQQSHNPDSTPRKKLPPRIPPAIPREQAQQHSESPYNPSGHAADIPVRLPSNGPPPPQNHHFKTKLPVLGQSLAVLRGQSSSQSPASQNQQQQQNHHHQQQQPQQQSQQHYLHHHEHNPTQQRAVSAGASTSQSDLYAKFANAYAQGNRSMSLNSSVRNPAYDKYHQGNKSHAVNGRVIPQKLDIYTAQNHSQNYQYTHQNQQQVQYHQQLHTEHHQSIPPPSNQRSPTSKSSATLTKAKSRNSLLGSRSRSFSSLTKLTRNNQSSTSPVLKQATRTVSSSSLNLKTIVTSSKKASVYPAMLSRVARKFQETITLGIKVKDGLEYKDSFTGVEAVDVICRLIRTTDRNLALLLGRALDAQKLFRDVTYEHRLRDSKNEVYIFNSTNDTDFYQLAAQNKANNETTTSFSVSVTNYGEVEQTKVNGVFTLLTECYSPTCTRDKLCYSIACPRRLEQQARNNMKINGDLMRADSKISMSGEESKSFLWSKTVSQAALDAVDKEELKKQEIVFETIMNQRDFVKDLDYIKKFWIRPLSESSIIRDKERDHFIRTIFHGVNAVYQANLRFADALTKRQKEQEIVERIGDILVEYIPSFESFIEYSTGYNIAKYEFKRQREINPLFARFIRETESLKESRRLEYDGFAAKPLQRLPRYQLLLKNIIKHTKKDSKDMEDLLKAQDMLQKLVVRYNQEYGHAVSRFEMLLLKASLVFRAGEYVDLKLENENRRYLHKCELKKRNYQDKENQGIVDVHLFDHALLFARKKMTNKKEQYKAHQRPIPIPLLYISMSENAPTVKQIRKAAARGTALVDNINAPLPVSSSSLLASDKVLSSQGLSRITTASTTTSIGTNAEDSSTSNVQSSAVGLTQTGNLFVTNGSPVASASTSTTSMLEIANPNDDHFNNYGSTNHNNGKFPITFTYFGRKGYELTLYAPSKQAQKELVEKIDNQYRKLIQDNDIFTLTPLKERFFDFSNRINCVVPCEGGTRLVYGTDSGVYCSDIINKQDGRNRIVTKPVNIIKKVNVMQISVLDNYQTVLILSDKKLLVWPLDILQNVQGCDPVKNAKSGKELMSHVSFFRVGICSGTTLVCAAKQGSSHLIKVFEPLNPIEQRKVNKKKFKNETRDFQFSSEPVSISFLKNKLCVGCTKGFEIVDVENRVTEFLLDPADTSLDFVIGKDGLKPLKIDRINYDFLLSYSDFSFFINTSGWKSRPRWMIYWEGVPQQFAIWYPYLVAFDPGFIEIRNVETGDLLRTIIADNIRFLHSSTQEILFVYEDENGFDVVTSLDFWLKRHNKGKKLKNVNE
ncbi:Rho GDP/GTP exchange factor [Komagataella phaffii CBS 7435]|uniref:Rho GDP/GTP exchange factor n=1 Tax=Komagataella phaffii (strain ATCC 76273 / CBS 7435 / CECT 11047 / NRRL Y-11430 / Wegner 21-1) TaxID=981350 RepID=F2QX04_KOMPC|nr:GQ67_03288T0 [Komagataella phaffii]AOA68611.1 GQ68_03257T0 [Komagataella phaffii GS115]CAH2449985.1 Rho GDP/GTP exchange factor [Komagataella phaffii CBS 7435]CCA39932.1 Rho GDP/GTP exchange factor [Komagataella phaffii CBS 7435]